MLGIPVMGSVAETAVVFAAGSVTAGTVGIVGAIVLTVGPTVMVGTIAAALTPRLPLPVAPNGMPVPPTGALGTMPSGDVAESEGVGITAACCAKAWPHSRAEAVVINRKRFMVLSSAGRAVRRVSRRRSLRRALRSALQS